MYNKENLAKLKKMDGLARQLMKAFWAFDKAAVADGAISVRRPSEPDFVLLCGGGHESISGGGPAG